MLNDTIILRTDAGVNVSFVRRNQIGSASQFVPVGDVPSAERKLRVGHEVTKSGTVNTLWAVSHLKTDPGNPTAAPRAAAVQIKIIRPSFVTAADMRDIVVQAVTGLQTDSNLNLFVNDPLDPVDKLLNQEQ